jgi:hypothetical protein
MVMALDQARSMPPPARPSVGPPMATPGAAAATTPAATPEPLPAQMPVAPRPAAVQTAAAPLPAQPSSVHELKTLVLSRHPLVVIETAEEERLDTVLAGVARDLRLAVFDWAVTHGLRRLPEGSPVYGTEDPAKLFAQIAELEVNGLFVLKDAAAHVAAPAVARAFRELLSRFAAPGTLSTVIMVGASVPLPEELDALAVRYDLALPSAAEYRAAIAAVAESLAANGQAAVELDAGDTDALAGALGGLTINQARQAVARVAIEDGHLHRADLSRLTELKAEALREDGPLEFFPSADNTAQLGGFAGLERWLDRARIGFSAQAAALNLTAPRGLLLVGVQGCGKSLAAKAIARRWELPLLKLDAGRLYDKYIGETEKNLRRAIAIAESMAPAVLWIDEIEKALAPSGDGSDDGGVSRRVLGTFLTWLQEKRKPVFVVATANDISALPPELLRKGRLDEIFFVDLPDAPEREAILRIHLAMRRQDAASIDLAAVVAASDGFSGAEIEQVVITALLESLQEQRPLDTAMLTAEIAATVPLSVSRADDVARLREFARERFVPVR